MRHSSAEITKTGKDYLSAINEFIEHRKKKNMETKAISLIPNGNKRNIKNPKDVENNQ